MKQRAMACTFLGDPFRIYDEVTQRIEEGLEEILAAHEEVELYFPGWFGEFPRACGGRPVGQGAASRQDCHPDSGGQRPMAGGTSGLLRF